MNVNSSQISGTQEVQGERVERPDLEGRVRRSIFSGAGEDKSERWEGQLHGIWAAPHPGKLGSAYSGD